MTLRLLRIDLNSQFSKPDLLPGFVEEKYLGARGAATWLLASYVDAYTGPR